MLRPKVLFWLVAAFAGLLLPESAYAVTAAQCVGSGGFVSINVCEYIGGAGPFEGQTVTGSSNSSDAADHAQSRANDEDGDNDESEDKASDDDDKDPWVGFASIHDNGGTVSSASGTVSGPGISSHTSQWSGGVDSAFNETKTFNLGGNQRLVFGLSFLYDDYNTSYTSSGLVPGFGTAGTMRERFYNFGGSIGYRNDSWYGGEILRGGLGSGSLNNTLAASTGSFDASRYSSDTFIGKTFTLYDTRVTRPAVMPTKAPPPAATGGYAVLLDVRAHLIYDWSRAGAFTDSTGFTVGAETFNTWSAGGLAKVSVLIPRDSLIWKPFIAATFDQQFGYKDAISIPAQTGQIADTIYLGNAQTFWGFRTGFDVRQAPGWDVGVQGFYKQSSEFRIAGAMAFLRYYMH